MQKIILPLLIFSHMAFSSSMYQNQYEGIKLINSKAENRLNKLKSKSLLEYEKIIEYYNYLTNSTKKSKVELLSRYPDAELHKKRYDYLVKTIPTIKKENNNKIKEIDDLTKENKHLQNVLNKLISYSNSELDYYTISVGDKEAFDVDHTQKLYATHYSKGEHVPQRLYLNGNYRVKINRILLNGEYLSEVSK